MHAGRDGCVNYHVNLFYVFYSLSDIPEDIVSFTVAIFNRNKRYKDQDIGTIV